MSCYRYSATLPPSCWRLKHNIYKNILDHQKLPYFSEYTYSPFFRPVQMVHQEAGSAEEVLDELVGHMRSEEAGALWRNLRLDWVRNWDQSCQTAVLLSRLQHTGRPPPTGPKRSGTAGTMAFLTCFFLSAFCRVDLLRLGGVVALPDRPARPVSSDQLD